MVIGAIEEGRHIKNSDRLNKFKIADLDIIRNLMQNFKEIYITHYIATEVSNLIDIKGRARALAFEAARLFFSEFKQIDSNIIENCTPKNFLTYGITDSSLIHLATNHIIFTDDGKLFPALFSANPHNIITLDDARRAYQS
jgi:hypothetical protein